MIKQGHIQDSGERENHPFAEVIAEYRRHARKIIERRRRPNDLKAVIYYIGTAAELEKM